MNLLYCKTSSSKPDFTQPDKPATGICLQLVKKHHCPKSTEGTPRTNRERGEIPSLLLRQQRLHFGTLARSHARKLARSHARTLALLKIFPMRHAPGAMRMAPGACPMLHANNYLG
jgi:hypothetical protein